MRSENAPGWIVILNGAPRSGKSSIAHAIQESFDGVWMNLGVDGFVAMTPPRYRPGIGLRPGGERPDLEPTVTRLYLALYDSIAAHSRLGINVVTDVGHHDSYSVPRGILPDCARRLIGLPALLVGVRCPVVVLIDRRRKCGWDAGLSESEVVARVEVWNEAAHVPGVYDLEVDTSTMSPGDCALAIRWRLESGMPPAALQSLAAASED